MKPLSLNSRRAGRGFTLPELIVTMAVMAILARVAMPQLAAFVQDIRAKEAAANLLEALLRARSQAVVSNSNAVLTAKGGDWGTGWTLTDSGGTTTYLSQSISSVDISSSVTSVTYGSSGRVTGSSSDISFHVLSQASDRGVSGEWCVTVKTSGRPYMATGAC